jgi:hypothetical protein
MNPMPERLELAGTLAYQVCSDTVCYPPTTLPLKWTVRVRRWVR